MRALRQDGSSRRRRVTAVLLPKLLAISKKFPDEVEVAAEPSSSWVIQEKVLKGLHLLKKAAKVLLQLDLFSQHEDLEETACTDLKCQHFRERSP